MGLWSRIESIFGIVSVSPTPKVMTASGVLPDAALPLAPETNHIFWDESAQPHTPVILISGQKADSDSVKAAVAMVRAQGDIPMVITEHGNRNAATDLARADGIVLLGNDYDIDPGLYGQSVDKHTLSEADPDLMRKAEAKKGARLTQKEADIVQNVPLRARYEADLLSAAIAQKAPVLGICGGMQRMNVLLHGDLRQHIADDVGDDRHMQTVAPYVPVLPVTFHEGSALAKLGQGIQTVIAPRPGAGHAQPLVLMENSFHHQAVGKLGDGLKASAVYADAFTGEDGRKHLLTAAIEADPAGPYGGQFLLGTQWHPEFGASPLGPRIFAGLSDAAKVRASEMASNPQRQALLQQDHEASRPVWMNSIIREHETRQRGDTLGTPEDAQLAQKQKPSPNLMGMAR